MNNEEKLLSILEKDFQELSNGEMQVLRNETRKMYGIQGKIDNDILLNSYLNMKRKYIHELEQVLVTVKHRLLGISEFSVAVNRLYPPGYRFPRLTVLTELLRECSILMDTLISPS